MELRRCPFAVQASSLEFSPLAADQKFMDTKIRQIETLLAHRIADMTQWLSRHGRGCEEKQAHLADGDERAYWHYGYLVALRDMLAALRGDAASH